MRKIPVVFVKENESGVCKKTYLTLHELSKIIAKYEVYMMGISFIITKDYDKIKVKESKPDSFAETTGVSQTNMMYASLKRKLDYEK